jgi:glycosyltransferase involved in cell wall biosynthesis
MTRLLYVQYTNPAEYPPLEHSSRLFVRNGWQVLFLGTSSLTGDTIRFPADQGVRVLLLPFCSGGWVQKLHYAWFAAWVLAWTLRWRPTWVYASDVLACPVALILSFLPGLKIIYHEHDAPAASLRSAAMRLSVAARTALVRRAEMCILPNRTRAEQFASQLGPRAVACVWNCPTLDELEPPRPALARRGLVVLYHGSIVPVRLPLTIVHALRRLPDDVRLRVVGFETIGHLGYTKVISSEAARVGVAERVQVVPPIATRADLLAYCGEADVGLSLMPTSTDDPNLRFMVGASNKPFDYLARGLALLVSDLPDWRQEYVDAGYGLACDPNDERSIAAALQWMYDHPEQTRVMGERGRQRAARDWNYDHQFGPVLARTAVKSPLVHAPA